MSLVELGRYYFPCLGFVYVSFCHCCCLCVFVVVVCLVCFCLFFVCCCCFFGFFGGDFGFCLFILLRFLLSSIGALTGLVWKWYLNFKYLTMLVSACLLSLKLSHPAHGN